MDYMDVVKKRRSVRKYLSKPIPEEVLNNILEAGRLAPSGGNAQNIIFGVVKDDEKKKSLVNAAGNQEWIASAPIIIAYCSYIDDDLSEVSKDDFGLIVNNTRFGKELVSYLNDYPNRKIMNTFWNNASPLIPGEHILLAATNYGLSGCWIGYLDILKASKILNLPDNIVCLFLMPLGYADEEPVEKDKKSLEDLIFYDEWK